MLPLGHVSSLGVNVVPAVELAEELELERLLRKATFRPRVAAGRVVDSAPVTLRYYLGAAAAP